MPKMLNHVCHDHKLYSSYDEATTALMIEVNTLRMNMGDDNAVVNVQLAGICVHFSICVHLSS